ncbi:MAG: type IV secretory system conjugative DNA transfer family protein, partial [Oscillospiraceae bacterium]
MLLAIVIMPVLCAIRSHKERWRIPTVQKSGTRRELLATDEIRTMDENKVLIIAHNKQPAFDTKNSYFLNKEY